MTHNLKRYDVVLMDFGKEAIGSETATDEIQKCISGMDNRQYEPRIMKELFDLYLIGRSANGYFSR